MTTLSEQTERERAAPCDATAGPLERVASRLSEHNTAVERSAAALLAVIATLLTVEAYGYGLFNGPQPGAGLIPCIVTMALLALALCWFVTAGRIDAPTIEDLSEAAQEPDTGGEDGRAQGRSGAGVVLFSVLWAVIPIVGFGLVGFVIAMTVYLAGMLIVIGRVRWWIAVPVTLVGCIAGAIGGDAIGLVLPDPLRILWMVGL